MVVPSYKGEYFRCPSCAKRFPWRAGLYLAAYPRVKANVWCGRCAMADARARGFWTWVDRELVTPEGAPIDTLF